VARGVNRLYVVRLRVALFGRVSTSQIFIRADRQRMLSCCTARVSEKVAAKVPNTFESPCNSFHPLIKKLVQSNSAIGGTPVQVRPPLLCERRGQDRRVGISGEIQESMYGATKKGNVPRKLCTHPSVARTLSPHTPLPAVDRGECNGRHVIYTVLSL